MINLSPTTFTNHHEPCDILNAPFIKEYQYRKREII